MTLPSPGSWLLEGSPLSTLGPVVPWVSVLQTFVCRHVDEALKTPAGGGGGGGEGDRGHLMIIPYGSICSWPGHVAFLVLVWNNPPPLSPHP